MNHPEIRTEIIIDEGQTSEEIRKELQESGINVNAAINKLDTLIEEFFMNQLQTYKKRYVQYERKDQDMFRLRMDVA